MKKKKFPNLFIIGAPKCGTTSLAIWLSEHPEIYFYIGNDKNSKVEPHYWLGNIPHYYKMSEKQYFAIFDNIDFKKYKYAGEASVWYLFFATSVIPSIEKHIEEPKYIVCIRNPIEMAYSLWHQYIKSGIELEINDFLKAFSLSDEREKGNLIKVNRVLGERIHHSSLNYKKVCSLGTQLEVLFNLIPQERLHIIVLDDIKEDPRREWKKLLKFLEVSDDNRNDFPVYNEKQIIKSQFWHNIYTKIINLAYLSYNLRKKIGLAHKGIIKKIKIIDLAFKKNYVKRELSKIERKYLLDIFIDEITKLECLLDRKFDKWKKLE